MDVLAQKRSALMDIVNHVRTLPTAVWAACEFLSAQAHFVFVVNFTVAEPSKSIFRQNAKALGWVDVRV